MKLNLFIILYITCSISLFAQKSNGIYGEPNWMNNWTSFKSATTEYPETDAVLSGVIDKSTKLEKTNTYLLRGKVYVTSDAVLTIEPGTVIRGENETCGTLIITKGAKIIAEGTPKEPIIFTSNKASSTRKPGNWGGIVILGNAPINKIDKDNKHILSDYDLNPEHAVYGNANPEDSSGILKYVRIEYAGKKEIGMKELNALTLAGVGKKTVLSHIQVSFCNGDAFNLLGGETNMTNLISYRAEDDDFDFSEGSQAIVSNSIAIRHPFSSNSGNSRCFEIDSYDKIENADLSKKLTSVKANAMTFINIEDNTQGLVREAIYLKEKCSLNLTNSVASRFASLLLLEDKITLSPDNFAKIVLKNITINRCKENIVSEEQSFNGKLKYWPDPASMGFDVNTIHPIEFFTSIDLKNNPDFRKKEAADSFVNNR